MTSERCTRPLGIDALLGYWLGELPQEAQEGIEEHYFGCESCAQRLGDLAAYASGIRVAIRAGAVRAVITPAFLRQLKRQGMQVREYSVEPGGGVACTIRMDDDAVVGRMQAPLAGVTRVDLLASLDPGDGVPQLSRIEDVPFDPDAGEVIALPSAAALKRLPAHTFRVRLVAVDAAGERQLGEYTFAHSPS